MFLTRPLPRQILHLPDRFIVAIFPLYVSFLVSFDEVSWIPYHIRSVSTARTERDRHKTVGIARKTTARHAHPGIFSLPDYDVKLVMQSYMDNVKTRGRICLPVFQQI